MKDILITTLKEYCKVLGLCYAGVLSFTAFLYFSLWTEQTPKQEIFEICIEFLSISIIACVFVVTPIFLVIYRNERKKYKRQQQISTPSSTLD